MIPDFIARWFVPAPDSGVADDIRRGKSPWLDSVHLLWSFWVFIVPLFNGGVSGYNLTWLLFTAISYPVFLLLFAKAQLAPRRTAHLYALGMAAMSLALLRWYPSGLSYFIYGCIMLRRSNMPFTPYMARLAMWNAVFVMLAWWIGYPKSLLIIIPVTVLAVSIISAVEQMSTEKNTALSLSQDEVRRLAANAERERIGRDLHDLLGHTLSLITLKLELSRKLFDRDPDAARCELADAEKVARHALAEVRSAVTGIRATDFIAELASARLLLESGGVELDYDDSPPQMPEAIERSLALVLREAVTNVARHAQASNVSIDLAIVDEAVHLRISDDGRGGVREYGNGLCGMRERVRALGGRLHVESSRAHGTCLRIDVPFPTVRILPAARQPVPVASQSSAALQGGQA